MDRVKPKQQTEFHNDDSRGGISIYGKLQWSRSIKSNNNSKNNNNRISNRYNVSIHPIIKYANRIFLGSLSLLIGCPVYAADVGGVSATANPIANSSGSVTNQAIQVLQGPYITNTYGGGIQCQGETMNITPFITGAGAFKRPWESEYDSPVYDMTTDDDGNLVNPGDILYYVPTRTGQKENYNLSIGVSATWSIPLDDTLQELCKTAARTNIDQQTQLTANKRLDFEIARLKNCGELMKAGIMFHPRSPYAKVCADVVLVNPPGVVANHTHELPTNFQTSSSSIPESPSSVPSDLQSSVEQSVDPSPASSQGLFGWFRLPFLSRDEKPSEEDQPAALLGGPIQWPPSQSQQSSKQPEQTGGTAPQQ